MVVIGHDKAGLESLLDENDPERMRSASVEGDVRDDAAMRGAVDLAEKSSVRCIWP